MRKDKENEGEEFHQGGSSPNAQEKAVRLAHSPSYLFYGVVDLMVKFRMAVPQMRSKRVSFMFHDKYKGVPKGYGMEDK